MNYIGDFTPGKTVRRYFNSHQADGGLVTLAGTPTAAVYRDSTTTESTAGVTLTPDFDARTGLHLVAVDTAADATFYAAGHDFTVVLTAGTVAGTPVANEILAEFSLANRSIAVDNAGRVDVGYVGGGAVLPGEDVILARGTVAVGTSATSFTATITGSNLLAVTGAYSGRTILFQTGGLATEPRTITTYTVSGDTATFDLTGNPLTSAPAAGDKFAVG